MADKEPLFSKTEKQQLASMAGSVGVMISTALLGSPLFLLGVAGLAATEVWMTRDEKK